MVDVLGVTRTRVKRLLVGQLLLNNSKMKEKVNALMTQNEKKSTKKKDAFIGVRLLN